jgi:hypothetical protein
MRGAILFSQRECTPTLLVTPAAAAELHHSRGIWRGMKSFLQACDAHVCQRHGLEPGSERAEALGKILIGEFYAFWEPFRERWQLPMDPETLMLEHFAQRVLEGLEIDEPEEEQP